jgi:predicted DNA-binding transcriptional regulator AlpA
MPRELLTTADVAEVLGVSARRVSQLADARPDFPAPYAVTRGKKAIRLWRPEDIDAWARQANRSPGRRQT